MDVSAAHQRARSVTCFDFAEVGSAGAGSLPPAGRREPIEVVMPAKRADFEREWAV
jgi:hypothetical protein